MATTPFVEDSPDPPKRRKPIGLWIVAGICIGACVCPLLLGAILFPVFIRARQGARAAVCFQRMDTIATAIRRYERQHGIYPNTMEQALRDARILDTARLRCTDIGEPGLGLGFAYNAAAFAGKSKSQLSADALDQPLMIEVSDVRSDDVLTPASKFSTRHGHFVNANFFGKGPVRLELTTEQLKLPILSIKNLASYEREPTSLAN